MNEWEKIARHYKEMVEYWERHKSKPAASARELFQALLPFVEAGEKFKAGLPRPIPEDALDECIEIEAGFCENARQAMTAYQREVDYVAYEKAKPAPDVAGLVEAVEKYLETITLSPSAKGCFTLDDLRSALAAHKPEVE